jgi:ketosteroid isomerase-like protein
MTDTALRVALAYFEAWTSQNMDEAMRHVADDIVCEAPAGRIQGAEAFAAFMTPFARSVRGARMIAAYGDDETALVMYDTETVPVPSAPGADCMTVRDGRIVHSRLIFDRAPFDAARAAAAKPD